jgi:hypothetical protein
LFKLGGQPQVGICLVCCQHAPLLQVVEQGEPGRHQQREVDRAVGGGAGEGDVPSQFPDVLAPQQGAAFSTRASASVTSSRPAWVSAR